MNEVSGSCVPVRCLFAPGQWLNYQNAVKKARSTSARCLPQGLPRTDMNSYAPFKIIQTPGVIAVLYEVDNTHRQIYTDGRPLPVDPQPTRGGYSVGRCEGDTLVVDAVGFNDVTWLDSGGHPHSDALRLQEDVMIKMTWRSATARRPAAIIPRLAKSSGMTETKWRMLCRSD